jgi:hypothetical protein
VDTEHHLIVTHEVTNTGSDRSQLAKVASQEKDILGAGPLDAVADRGYFNSPEILACEQADITVTLPRPMTSGAKADSRFGKQDFVYLPTEDVYRCPAGEKLAYRCTNEDDGMPALPAQIPAYDRTRAANHARGTRARARRGAAASR